MFELSFPPYGLNGLFKAVLAFLGVYSACGLSSIVGVLMGCNGSYWFDLACPLFLANCLLDVRIFSD